MVRTMRQPPDKMPRVMAVAHSKTTQKGTVNSGMNPPINSTMVMMPMLF